MDWAKANVLTRAVLPALKELIPAEEAAQELVRGWNWAAGFGLLKEIPVIVAIRDGAARVEERRARPGELNLVFLTAKSLVAAMSGQAPIPFPLPTGGFHRFGGLKKFDALGKLLKEFLEGAKKAGASEASLTAVFGVLSRALPIVAKADAIAAKTLRGCSPATANLAITPLGFYSAIVWDGTELHCTPDTHIENANVDIEFRSIEAVRSAVAGTLDFQAAVGSGEVRVEGRVLFADALGVVMDRAEVYLAV